MLELASQGDQTMTIARLGLLSLQRLEKTMLRLSNPALAEPGDRRAARG